MKALIATLLCWCFFSCILECSGVTDDESYQNDGIPPPSIIVTPTDLAVTSHETITLNCAVTGATNSLYSWYFNNQLITSTDRTLVHSNGTLVIENAVGGDSGVYNCVTLNNFGSLKAKATVKVNVLPTIEIAPENHKNIKSGATVVFYCEADGTPKPYLTWTKEGKPVTQTNRIYLSNENTELHIEHVKENDAGLYVCIAENSNGKTESGAKLSVRSIRGAPKLLVEPYDLDVFVGSTIEIPCKGEGEPIPQVKWKKDGRTITSGAIRYRISASGSLFITNVTDSDTGRFECSLSNDFGRATAHGLITVKSNDVQTPGDRFVRIAFAEASKEVDMAINQTVASLFGNHTGEKKHHGDLFRLFRFPTAPARELARAAEIYERTLVNIRKHVESGSMLVANKSDFNYIDLLSTEHLELVARLSGCESHRNNTDCSDMCFHSKYRSIEGTCNNLQNTNWGASLTGFRRILNPIYENGFSTPIGWTKGKLYNGFVKPSARHVSSSLISTKDITPDDSITHMMMQWGQFLDHDLDHAIPSVSSESWDGIDCKKSCEYAAPCYPIEIPPNDPRVKNRRCLDFVRSSAICGSGMTSLFFETIQPREQINQLTAFIDASQVYGYSKDFAQELRNLTTDDGLLREGVTFPDQKPMLPFSSKADGIDCRRNLDESNINCFVAGDIRVNEQIGLLAMHVLWFREHNRIAATLRRINPHWCGETIFQEARKIVGAQMQHITYSHWLPHILGDEGMEMLGKYKEYNPNLNPSISNEFATAALRFGHTLINPILHRLDSNFNEIPQGHLPLHKAFFAPWRVVYEGGIDPLMRGLFSVPAKLKMPTQNLNTELTEKLFKTVTSVALDLAAINIQRSRDHAIPGYNEYRRVCNLTYAETFDDLKTEITSEDVRNKLKEIYGHVSNIDIFVGGILEDQVKGGRVGPLFRCLLIDQFQRLRDGDRFYYENPSVFKPEQLTQIKQSSLARALCNNGDNITSITQNVFLLSKLQGGYTSCENVPKIDLNFWMDCQKCAVENTNIVSKEVLIKRRRQSRLKREVEVFGNSSMSSFGDDEFLIKRIDDLESMVDGFEKSLEEMRRELKKMGKSNA